MNKQFIKYYKENMLTVYRELSDIILIDVN